MKILLRRGKDRLSTARFGVVVVGNSIAAGDRRAPELPVRETVRSPLPVVKIVIDNDIESDPR
jgi:hypothetical protein